MYIFWFILSATFFTIAIFKFRSKKRTKPLDEEPVYQKCESPDNYEPPNHKIKFTLTLNELTTSNQEPIPIKDVYGHDDLWQIGMNVECARKDRKMTQKELAMKLGYKSASFVSRLERGETEQLEHATVVKIADALGVSVEYLLR